MRIETTKLEGVKRIYTPVFEDDRGLNRPLYDSVDYKQLGIDFIQDSISVSRRNVLRGIHSDSQTWKLVACLYGAIYLVVVDCDSYSRQFGKWVPFILSADRGLQVLIGPSYGTGHLILTEWAVFHYKQSTHYDRKSQSTHRYDDERFNIEWPIAYPILSERDKNAIS